MKITQVAVIFIVVLFVFHVYFLPDYVLRYFLEDNAVYKNRSKVLFTFDDAPSQYTHSVLDCLKKENIKAVFFVLADRVPGNEDVLNRIVQEGHIIGNHGTTDRIHAFSNKAAFERELLDANEKLQPWLQFQEARLFRPGFGFFNSSMLETLKKHDYTMMLGNVFPYDSFVTSPTVNAWYVKSKLRDDSIVILHERASTTATLQKIFS